MVPQLGAPHIRTIIWVQNMPDIDGIVTAIILAIEDSLDWLGIWADPALVLARGSGGAGVSTFLSMFACVRTVKTSPEVR